MQRIIVIAILFCASTTFAQTPFDNFDTTLKSVPLFKSDKPQKFRLEVMQTNTDARYLVLDVDNAALLLYNAHDSLIGTSKLKPKQVKFLSVDPYTRKYPELSTYQFASNTPMQAIDLDGLECFLVHGTASDPSRWTMKPEIIDEYLRISGNTKKDATFEWGLRVSDKQPDATKVGNGYFNQVSDREIAAKALVQHIISSGLIDPKEGVITLVGHSHGGNVAILAADGLRAYLDSKPEYKDMKINIITVATPAESTPLASENPREHMNSINYHLQLYNEADPVQRTLSNVVKDKLQVKLPFTREYKNYNPLSKDFTVNQEIDVSKYYNKPLIATDIHAHFFDAEHPDLLKQVQPIYKKE